MVYIYIWCMCVCASIYTYTIIYSWVNGRTKAIQELSWYVTVPLKKKHVFFGEKNNWTRPVAVSAAMAESRAQRCHAHMPAAFMSTVWALHGVIQKQPETTLHNRVPSFQANMQKTRKHFGLDWGNDGWSKVEVRIFRIAAGTCARIYMIYDLYAFMIECYRQWPRSWNRGGNFSFRWGLLLTFWLQEGNGMERSCISAGHCLLHCTPLLAGNMRNFLQVQFPSAHDMDIICEWHIKYLMYLFMCLLVGLFVCCFFVVSLYTENGVHTMHYNFHVLHSTLY